MDGKLSSHNPLKYSLIVNFFRIYNLSLLTIATTEKIIILDLYALNASKVMADFKAVFESDLYTKIVYKSELLLDNLKNCFDINMKGVFDVLIAAEIHYPKGQIENLNSFIENVLGFHPEIDENEVFQRPFSQEILKNVGSKAAYLLALHKTLAQKNFTELFTRRIEESQPKTEIEDFCGRC